MAHSNQTVVLAAGQELHGMVQTRMPDKRTFSQGGDDPAAKKARTEIEADAAAQPERKRKSRVSTRRLPRLLIDQPH